MKEWSRARGFLLPAMTEVTEAEVIGRLTEGSVQLWIGEDCAIISEVVDEPRTIHLWLAGGSLREIIALAPGMAAWARSMGCVAATINGRRGWKRAMRNIGFVGDDILWKVL